MADVSSLLPISDSKSASEQEDKMKQAVICLMFLGLAGCVNLQHGIISFVPKISDSNEASELFVIRKKSFIGSAISFNVALDEQEIFAIKTGEYIKFPVVAGEHSVGVRCYSAWIPMMTQNIKVNVSCAPKEKYYFLISPSMGWNCAKIEVLKKEDGLKLLSESTFYSIER